MKCLPQPLSKLTFAAQFLTILKLKKSQRQSGVFKSGDKPGGKLARAFFGKLDSTLAKKSKQLDTIFPAS